MHQNSTRKMSLRGSFFNASETVIDFLVKYIETSTDVNTRTGVSILVWKYSPSKATGT